MIPKSIVISSFLWKFLERFSVQVSSFIISIVLARLLMPEEYGIIALVLVFINLASVIVEGGFSTALIQKQEYNNKDFSTVFWISICVSIVLYIIIYISSPIISQFYKNPELVDVIRIISISVLFGAINSVQRAYISKMMLFDKLFKSSFISVVISGIIGIVLAYRGFGVWALVVQYVLSQFLNSVILWIIVKWRPLLIVSYSSFKSLYDYGWKILLTNLMVSVFVNIRSLLIGHYFSPNALAFFDKGKQFPSMLMENINSSIQTILLPVLSEQQNNRERLKIMLRRTIKTSALFIFPMMVGLIICSDSIIHILLTDKWMGAAKFLQIFSIAFMLMPIQIANMEAIKALGYSSITLKLESHKKILEIIVLIVSFMGGVEGIAWGVVVYNGLCLLINLYPCKKILNYGYFEQLRDILPILIISVLMGLCVFLVGNLFDTINAVALIIIQVLIGIFVYTYLCFQFRLETFMYLYSTAKQYVKNLK